MLKEYKVKRISGKPDWASIEAINIGVRYRDTKDDVSAEAKFCYDEEGIFVHLSTTEPHSPAKGKDFLCEPCLDSCLEFFLIANESDPRYLNFEVTPVGTMHLRIGPDRNDRTPIEFVGSGIRVQTSVTPLEGWRAMIYIPYSFLNSYYGSCTRSMRGNFYKCGDLSPIEHYSMWNPVMVEVPDYHRPDFFGTLTLSDEEI